MSAHMADERVNQLVTRTTRVAITILTDLVDKYFKCIFEGFLKERVARELFVHKRSIFVVQREQLPYERRIRATTNNVHVGSPRVGVYAPRYKTDIITFF